MAENKHVKKETKEIIKNEKITGKKLIKFYHSKTPKTVKEENLGEVMRNMRKK